MPVGQGEYWKHPLKWIRDVFLKSIVRCMHELLLRFQMQRPLRENISEQLQLQWRQLVRLYQEPNFKKKFSYITVKYHFPKHCLNKRIEWPMLARSQKKIPPWLLFYWVFGQSNLSLCLKWFQQGHGCKDFPYKTKGTKNCLCAQI